MKRKAVPFPILILIWLVIAGGVFWWWQGREEKPTSIEESGQAALVETKPLSGVDTPRGVVESFYKYLYQGKYREAENLLAPDYLNFVGSAGGLRESWRKTPTSEKPARVVITNEEITGDTAEVLLIGYNSNGEKLEGEGVMTLVKIKGKWKLAMPGQDNSTNYKTEPEAESSLSDERRIADLKQVRAVYEIYYAEYGKYPDWPKDDLVPDYFSSKSAFTEKNIYYMGYGDQKLCLWTELKEKDGYYVISHCGEKETQKSPSGSFDYCCELSKP